MNYISGCYEKEYFLIAYETAMQPLRGSKFWKIDEYALIEPPIVKKQPGRLKKNRRKDKFEAKKIPASGRLSKKGSEMTCVICNQVGHNRRSCKNKGNSSSGGNVGSHAEPMQSQVGSSFHPESSSQL